MGELSNFRNALLPIFAAIDRVVAPANSGFGIMMTTDIAFAIGVRAFKGQLGFTMSTIFTNLAFATNLADINAPMMTILLA